MEELVAIDELWRCELVEDTRVDEVDVRVLDVIEDETILQRPKPFWHDFGAQ